MTQKKCERLSEILRDKITSGVIGFGEKMPSENTLAEQYNMSRQVVRQAIEILRSEGLVESLQGSGTYVKNDVRGKGSPSSVSVILPYDDDYIFGSFINGIHATLSRYGYIVELHITHNDPYEEERVLTSVLNNMPAGIIIDPARSLCPRLHTDLYSAIKNRNIPCISINCRIPNMDFPVIAMNDVTSGRIATKYLISKGHQEIGFICNVDSAPGQLRLKGYLCEMDSAGFTTNAIHTVNYCSDDEQDFFSGAFDDFILQRLSGCTAVVCFNDRIAVKMIHLFERHNIRVPGDVSIVGHDNALMSEYITPKLTTVMHLKTNLGMIAAENLVHLIKDSHFAADRIIEPELIERESVRSLD